MLEFVNFLQNAKNISKKITQHFMSKQACLGFFTALVPNNSAIDDATTITLLARSLEKSNDELLKSYIEKIPESSFISQEEFVDFKTRILVGIYLLKWSNYSSTITYYINKPLIELFQNDLEIQSLAEMDSRVADASLEALSQYCSYVYDNRTLILYGELNKRLGGAIQLEIHNIRKDKFTEDSSWCGLCNEVMRTIGISNLS